MRLFNTASETAVAFVVGLFNEEINRQDLAPTIDKYFEEHFKAPLSDKGIAARDRLKALVAEAGEDLIIETLARMYISGYREDKSVVDITSVLGAGMNHKAKTCADGCRWCSLMFYLLSEYHLVEVSRDYTTNRNKVYIKHIEGIEDYSPCLNLPKGHSTHYSGRILGSMFNKDYEGLDHCEELISRIQSIPLKWNWLLLEQEGGITYSSPTLEEYEEYCATHNYTGSYEEYDKLLKESWDYYLGMFTANIKGYIEKNQNLFYNTYAPDSRGRLYVTNATGDFVGIKQIRAVTQFCTSCKVQVDEKYLRMLNNR